MLDRSSVEPLYLQLRRHLERRIHAGEFPVGSFFPPESALSAEYDVSRVTVRNAIAALTESGVLSRNRGRGTVVLRERGLHAGNGKYLLGIVFNRLSSEFIASVLAGFEAETREHDSLTIVGASDEDPNVELACLDRLHNAGAASISILACESSIAADSLVDLADRGVHIGLIDREPGLAGLDYVGSDHAAGTWSAAQHLVRCGFERLIFADYQSILSSVQQRQKGFLDGARDAGATVLQSHVMIDEIERALETYARTERVGIVAVNDIVAIRAYQAARSVGLRVGIDVGIVGFDNLLQDKYLDPPLTSVAQNGFLLGRRAAMHALERLDGTRTTVSRTILPTQLVIRESCGEKV